MDVYYLTEEQMMEVYQLPIAPVVPHELRPYISAASSPSTRASYQGRTFVYAASPATSPQCDRIVAAQHGDFVVATHSSLAQCALQLAVVDITLQQGELYHNGACELTTGMLKCTGKPIKFPLPWGSEDTWLDQAVCSAVAAKLGIAASHLKHGTRTKMNVSGEMIDCMQWLLLPTVTESQQSILSRGAARGAACGPVKIAKAAAKLAVAAELSALALDEAQSAIDADASSASGAAAAATKAPDTSAAADAVPAMSSMGIVNVGNTCFVSALLQALYATKLFRRTVLRFDHAAAVAASAAAAKAKAESAATEDSSGGGTSAVAALASSITVAPRPLDLSRPLSSFAATVEADVVCLAADAGDEGAATSQMAVEEEAPPPLSSLISPRATLERELHAIGLVESLRRLFVLMAKASQLDLIDANASALELVVTSSPPPRESDDGADDLVAGRYVLESYALTTNDGNLCAPVFARRSESSAVEEGESDSDMMLFVAPVVNSAPMCAAEDASKPQLAWIFSTRAQMLALLRTKRSITSAELLSGDVPTAGIFRFGDDSAAALRADAAAPFVWSDVALSATSEDSSCRGGWRTAAARSERDAAAETSDLSAKATTTTIVALFEEAVEAGYSEDAMRTRFKCGMDGVAAVISAQIVAARAQSLCATAEQTAQIDRFVINKYKVAVAVDANEFIKAQAAREMKTEFGLEQTLSTIAGAVERAARRMQRASFLVKSDLKARAMNDGALFGSPTDGEDDEVGEEVRASPYDDDALAAALERKVRAGTGRQASITVRRAADSIGFIERLFRFYAFDESKDKPELGAMGSSAEAFDVLMNAIVTTSNLGAFGAAFPSGEYEEEEEEEEEEAEEGGAHALLASASAEDELDGIAIGSLSFLSETLGVMMHGDTSSSTGEVGAVINLNWCERNVHAVDDVYAALKRRGGLRLRASDNHLPPLLVFSLAPWRIQLDGANKQRLRAEQSPSLSSLQQWPLPLPLQHTFRVDTEIYFRVPGECVHRGSRAAPLDPATLKLSRKAAALQGKIGKLVAQRVEVDAMRSSTRARAVQDLDDDEFAVEQDVMRLQASLGALIRRETTAHATLREDMRLDAKANAEPMGHYLLRSVIVQKGTYVSERSLSLRELSLSLSPPLSLTLMGSIYITSSPPTF